MTDRIEASYDVVVVGGGLAGVCAAISAARHGCRTALVQDRPVFGGGSSSEIRVAPGGANHGGAWARETGIVEEMQIEERTRNHDLFRNGLINSQWDLVLYEWVKAEAHLTPYLNTVVHGVEKTAADRISAVVGVQLGSERVFLLSAEWFVDCTGDGTVGALAGAEFRMGREAKDEFDESLAPDAADGGTQGSSLLFRAHDVGRPVPFEPPSWAEDYPTEESLLNRAHGAYNGREYVGYWWIEVGAPYNTIDRNEDIRDEALRHVLGVWDHIKNHGDHRAENLALDWIGMVPGKRESRRLMGDYILTEHDVRSQHLFRDRVAYGGWFIDIHTMGGILAKGQPPEPLHGDPDLSDQVRVEPYSIPFRCLYSRNIGNLFMAGRDISATHVALATTRLMLTGAVMGQAVGTAAALCKKYGTAPRGIVEEHIEELQQVLLKDDCFIPDLPNRDPNDLARSATVTGTSQAPLSLEPKEGASSLEDPRSQIFPVTDGRLEKLGLHLRSSLDRDVEVTLSLVPASDVWHFNEPPSEELVISKAVVPAGYAGWVDFPIEVDTERRLYRINVEACEGIAWSHAAPVPGVAAAYRRIGWTRWVHQRPVYAMRLDPTSLPFGPENVVSGVARPEGWTHIWISDPAEGLPQSVTLDFGREVVFDTVYLTFDTCLHVDFGEFPPLYRIPECVRDYALWGEIEGNRRVLVEVEGNTQRRRVHRFDPVRATELRLEVRGTNGVDSARVYEIRVYREIP